MTTAALLACDVEGGSAMHSLDFTDVPDLSHCKAWFSLDDQIVQAFEKLPQTLDRAKSALRFCQFMGSSEAGDLNIRHGYMRAALGEFGGMEDTLKRELPRLGITDRPIKANTGSQPLLHIIRELRNFEFHLHSSPLTARQRSAFWGNPQKPSDAARIDLHLWVIDDLSEAQFRQLANAKHYQPGDIPQLLAWFNAAQKEWGINQLIFMAVEAFCYSIISTYSLPSL